MSHLTVVYLLDKQIWTFRELLYFFVWRDIKVRSKQTVLGISWAVFQPLITMVIFSIVFGKLAKISSDGAPYPIFSYAGLLPWQLFSRAISNSTSSLINNQNMVTKVYIPRIIFPLSTSLSRLVDFCIALLIFFRLMIFYSIIPTWKFLFLPVLIFLALFTSMSISLWLSAHYVRYRDIKFITPFLIQDMVLRHSSSLSDHTNTGKMAVALQFQPHDGYC